MQHDLIHRFWYSNRFHFSDLAPWPHCSTISSLPDLHLTRKTSLSQPFVPFELSPHHPTSPNRFGRNPKARSSQMQGHYPSRPPRAWKDCNTWLLAGEKAVWNVSSCFPKISGNHALKLNTWGKAGVAVNTVQPPKQSSHVARHGTVQARSTKQLTAFQGWLMPHC